MKILLIGNGGREHAIAEALARSKKKPDIFTFANKVNPGIRKLSKGYQLASSLSDFEALKKFAKEVKPDFAFVGPDNPIADGAADLLETLDIPSVAPKKTQAQLESSKFFTRNLLEKYAIPGNPKFKQFKSEEGIMAYLKELGEQYVVKADGLAFGKGVKVSGDHLQSHEEAHCFAKEALSSGHSSVVIEEKLEGVEFSLMAFADGEHLAFMPVVQDHKRAYDGDQGPNTGGMGSYSDVNHSMPFLSEKDLEDAKEICRKVLAAVKKETGGAYKGILYGGFIAVRSGVKLIEFNARFGDPEAMNVLPILETDFVDVCQAIIAGTLDKLPIHFAKKATVCLYVVPEGYPDTPLAGQPLAIGPMLGGVKLYYSSVNMIGENIVTSSSRSIGVTGIGESIEEARLKAVSGVQHIKGKIFYRKDIGSAALLQKKIQMLAFLRAH